MVLTMVHTHVKQLWCKPMVGTEKNLLILNQEIHNFIQFTACDISQLET